VSRLAVTRLDPADLDGLRRHVSNVDRDGAFERIGLQGIAIGRGALQQLPARVSGLRAPGPLAIVQDSTPMRRGGGDLKIEVQRLLEPLGELRTVVLVSPSQPLHADEGILADADRGIAGAGCVVSVGSGTITDIAKDATHRAGDLPLVVVQTAVSVNAFSDNMAVLLRDGVKRTVPSRWPDILLVDEEIIAAAPPEMNRAGYGELAAMFTAPADWYLASAVAGDGSYRDAPVDMLRGYADWYLDAAESICAADGPATLELARLMTLSGITLGMVGRTSPLSGTEHLISHLLDMAAAAQGAETAFHGAQVGMAAILAAVVWRHVLAELDPSALVQNAAYPTAEEIRGQVRAAFEPLDSRGDLVDECWHDVSAKLERWHAARQRNHAFVEAWPDHAATLQSLLPDPALLAGALRRAGAPLRFRDLRPSVDAATARWALMNCHLMRERFTVVDLARFAGLWNERFVDRILSEAATLGAGL
jgi:glycerol-1-phosphate dehydrogenase [NAD(P)+]